MGNPNTRASKEETFTNNRLQNVPDAFDLDVAISPKLSKDLFDPKKIKEEEIQQMAAKQTETTPGAENRGNHGNWQDLADSPLIYAPHPVSLVKVCFDRFEYKAIRNDASYSELVGPTMQVTAAFSTPSGFNPNSPTFVPAFSAHRNISPINTMTPLQTVGRQNYQYHGPPITPFVHVSPQPSKNDSLYYTTPSKQSFDCPSPFNPVKAAAKDKKQPRRQQPQTCLQQYDSKSPVTKLQKQDASRKDIIISIDGVKRNIEEVTERYLPNGEPYQIVSKGAVEKDALAWLGKMSVEEKTEYMEKCWVEIVVPMKSQEGEDAEIAANEEERTTSETNSSTNAPPNSGAHVSVKQTPFAHPIITVLKSLPLDFLTTTTKLTVTLSFPSLLTSSTPTGPSALLPPPRANFTLGNSTHTIPSSPSIYTSNPNFTLALYVAHHINAFSSLTKLEIIIAPPSNMRTPMTLPQLNCFLPFYDLEYTEWEARWKTGFMSRSEGVRGWPLGYLNGERDKILEAREGEGEGGGGVLR